MAKNIPQPFLDRLSQRNGLAKRPISNAGAETVLGDNVYLSVERRLQFDQQAAEIKQAASGLQVHEKIDIAQRIVSPRATEPKTRTFRAPRLVAIRRISSRFMARSSCKVMAPPILARNRRHRTRHFEMHRAAAEADEFGISKRLRYSSEQSAGGCGGPESVGRGGVGEKPFEGFAPTGPA
jgi:hypothetical protein